MKSRGKESLKKTWSRRVVFTFEFFMICVHAASAPQPQRISQAPVFAESQTTARWFRLNRNRFDRPPGPARLTLCFRAPSLSSMSFFLASQLSSFSLCKMNKSCVICFCRPVREILWCQTIYCFILFAMLSCVWKKLWILQSLPKESMKQQPGIEIVKMRLWLGSIFNGEYVLFIEFA